MQTVPGSSRARGRHWPENVLHVVGSLHAGGQEAWMVRVVGRADPDDPEIQTAFVLTSNGLQKWQLTLGEPDRLYYERDFSRLAEIQ